MYREYGSKRLTDVTAKVDPYIAPIYSPVVLQRRQPLLLLTCSGTAMTPDALPPRDMAIPKRLIVPYLEDYTLRLPVSIEPSQLSPRMNSSEFLPRKKGGWLLFYMLAEHGYREVAADVI